MDGSLTNFKIIYDFTIILSTHTQADHGRVRFCILGHPYLYWSNSVTNWLPTNEWKDIGKDRGKDSGKDGVGAVDDDFPVPGK